MICNHLLGHLNDYDYIPLYFYTIKETLSRYSESTKRLANNGFGKPIERKKYLDKRFCLADMFNYCPRCGEKINWKKIKQEVK